MKVLRMADAPPVGKWDAAAWDRIVSGDPCFWSGMRTTRYSPAELARVVFGRWPS